MTDLGILERIESLLREQNELLDSINRNLGGSFAHEKARDEPETLETEGVKGEETATARKKKKKKRTSKNEEAAETAEEAVDWIHQCTELCRRKVRDKVNPEKLREVIRSFGISQLAEATQEQAKSIHASIGELK